MDNSKDKVIKNIFNLLNSLGFDCDLTTIDINIDKCCDCKKKEKEECVKDTCKEECKQEKPNKITVEIDSEKLIILSKEELEKSKKEYMELTAEIGEVIKKQMYLYSILMGKLKFVNTNIFQSFVKYCKDFGNVYTVE